MATPTLGPVDYVLLVLLLLSSAVIGAIFGCFKSKKSSANEFLLGIYTTDLDEWRVVMIVLFLSSWRRHERSYLLKYCSILLNRSIFFRCFRQRWASWSRFFRLSHFWAHRAKCTCMARCTVIKVWGWQGSLAQGRVRVEKCDRYRSYWWLLICLVQRSGVRDTQ